MAQFLIKIVNHFASEIITKRLANSRAFQQFALKTHLKVEETKKVAENPEEAIKILRGAGEKVKAEAESAASSFERFKAALRNEVAQGIRSGGAGRAGVAGSSSSGRSTVASRPPPKGGIHSAIDARIRRRKREGQPKK